MANKGWRDVLLDKIIHHEHTRNGSGLAPKSYKKMAESSVIEVLDKATETDRLQLKVKRMVEESNKEYEEEKKRLGKLWEILSLLGGNSIHVGHEKSDNIEENALLEEIEHLAKLNMSTFRAVQAALAAKE